MKDLIDAPRAGAISSVVIVDDHPLSSDALGGAIGLAFPDARLDTVQSLQAALALLAEGLAPDLVIFDLKLSDVTGLSGVQALRRVLPETPILMISSLTSVQIAPALIEDGASGFLPKDVSAPVLRHALAEIAAGRRYVHPCYCGTACDEISSHPELSELTPQQRKIMKLICAGMPDKQIAYELSLAEATVKVRTTALLRRLGLRNRTQAAVPVESAQPVTRSARARPASAPF